MILLIDNYDSFSYNLYQLIGEINPEIMVVRNDKISLEQIRQLNPTHIILSPGPGRPQDAGICISLVRNLYKQYPILGVCLGHQSICEAFGGTIGYAKELYHGKTSTISLSESSLFKHLPREINVARYHSLALLSETLPCELRITAVTNDNEIMAVEHKQYPVYGVQFHPESILTPQGKTILKNFLGGK